jgi:hypothetical protein
LPLVAFAGGASEIRFSLNDNQGAALETCRRRATVPGKEKLSGESVALTAVFPHGDHLQIPRHVKAGGAGVFAGDDFHNSILSHSQKLLPGVFRRNQAAV